MGVEPGGFWFIESDDEFIRFHAQLGHDIEFIIRV